MIINSSPSLDMISIRFVSLGFGTWLTQRGPMLLQEVLVLRLCPTIGK